MSDLDRIKVLGKNDKKQYVEILRAGPTFGFCFSESGKAIYAPKPKKLGEQWYPTSIVRRHADYQSTHYGDSILVPVWVLMNNRIEY